MERAIDHRDERETIQVPRKAVTLRYELRLQERERERERGEERERERYDRCSRDNQQRGVKLSRKGARTTAIFKASHRLAPDRRDTQHRVEKKYTVSLSEPPKTKGTRRARRNEGNARTIRALTARRSPIDEMEFKFNVNKLLPRKINKVTHNLVPEDFKGDRRELNECQRLLSRILDDMGEASARAQGLNKPITSALKLRDTDHTIYLLVDNEANSGLGSVVGLLKTGSKNLFLFNEMGEHYQLQARCILDFYVHESRQRMGLGNILYQHMLSEENIRPVKLAIDRPSEKFLAFLRKYYGLSKIIPQNNKFVVFEGFFDDESRDVKNNRYSLPPRMSLDDGTPGNNNNNGKNSASLNGIPYVTSVSRSSYGRYAAARPPCSMANIIHNTAMLGQSTERTGSSNSDRASSPPPLKLERPRSLSIYSEEEQKQRSLEINTVPTPIVPDNQTKPFVPILLEAEKTEKNVKPSPSCGQEVTTGTNQHGHLDLKFYHSPLW